MEWVGELIRHWRADEASTYNSWFLWAERIKNFRSIRRGIQLVIDEIADIGGGRPLGFGAKRVRSLPDGIAQVLAEHLSELPPAREELQAEQLALPITQRPIGDICPECGEATLLNVEGCRKCQSCGYSEC